MMKIIISPSKTFKLTHPISKLAPQPLFINDAQQLFSYIKTLDLEATQTLFKLSSKKSLEVYEMHQNHGQQLYYAIEMYAGTVFAQLNLASYDQTWINEHLVILDAWYGIVKPYDLIAPYRLDFTIKLPFVNLKKYWQHKINSYFPANELIINFAAKEFSQLITSAKMITPRFKFQQGQIKRRRGQLLHQIFTTKTVDHLL